METFLSYEKFTHLLPVRQLRKLCWWKIFAKIHRQSLQIALIFKILFQKPTRLSVFGKKFDPADLVTRDVSSLLLSCLCSIYFGFYKVNMAGNTRFYNTRQNKTEYVKLFSAFVNWKEFSRNGNKIDKFLATKKRFLAKYFYFKTCHVILRSSSCMYTASCTRNLQTDKMLRELERLKILLSFCSRCCTIFWREKSQNSSVQFFAKNVARGNSVQNGLNFPAKSLSIYTKSFSGHYLIESQLTN